MGELGHLLLNERQSGYFEPDVVMPVQFYAGLGRGVDRGERRLIAAVLEDAVNCFQKHLAAPDNRGRRLFREAERWIMVEDKSAPFSFETVCDFLGLNPNSLRRRLRTWARTTTPTAESAPSATKRVDRNAGTPAAGRREPAPRPASSSTSARRRTAS